MRRCGCLPTQPLLVTALAGLLLAMPAAADQVVYFVNGKAITVKKVETGDRLTILEIDGGGRIGVPTAQIDRIEELQLSPPSQGVVAPPVAAAPTQDAPAAPAANAGQPAAALQQASQPTGPGFGGQPAQPSSGPAGLTPLQISGSPRQEGTAPQSAAAPGAAARRPNMQPGGGRQMNARRDGAIGQPNVGLKRPGPRSGAFRGRPMASSYQPPLAPSERRLQNRPDPGEPPSTGASSPPAPEIPPAVDPAALPEETDGEPADDLPAEDDADSSEPPAEDGGEPTEER